MPLIDATEVAIPTALAQWARERPDEPAFTFVDYVSDPAGVPETVTWSALQRRARNVAQELESCGSVGDRAVIAAPQCLGYIVAFLGALEAGWIPVPLSVPQLGAHDDRISSVLTDSRPAAVLTTLAAAAGLRPYLQADGREATALLEVDAIDLDGPCEFAVPQVRPKTAYLQYTSGSTRRPAGVMISHRNLAANFDQTMQAYYADTGDVAPSGTTMVSWLPFYHDMGMFIGVVAPILGGLRAEVTSPMSFLMRPSRWMQMMARNSQVFTPAPNFALELAVRRVADKDMAGLDLTGVTHVIIGAERVHAATLARFTDRFAPFHLRPEVLRPSYGLAEATVYVAARAEAEHPAVVRFDSEKLAGGIAQRSATGQDLVSYGAPRSPAVRIVDPETRTEKPAGAIGEIWVLGDNVAEGYWRNPAQTGETFGAGLVEPSAGTPKVPWLRTGDLGAISDGELFIMGRIKDLVIVDGRNHYPDDLEATVHEITGGRVAVISVPGDDGEKLAVITEFMFNGETDAELPEKVAAVKIAVRRAISTVHGIRVEDLVMVAPGSIPVTTSGKVRRSCCADQYRSGLFTRIG